MPYRSKRSRQEAFRSGKLAAAGSTKTLVPFTKTVKSICCGGLKWATATANQGTGSCAFDVNNWSSPATAVSKINVLDHGTTLNRPSEHVQAKALGYDECLVKSSLYRINLRYIGTDSNVADWVFAYKFSTSSSNAFGSDYGYGVTSVDNWFDLKQSRGWVYHRMSGTGSGGSMYPSAKQIDIRIPNVPSLTFKMVDAEQTTNGATDINDLKHNISTGAVTSNSRLFLHMAFIHIDGHAIPASGSVTIDVDVYQNVKLYRDQGQEEMIDEAVQLV